MAVGMDQGFFLLDAAGTKEIGNVGLVFAEAFEAFLVENIATGVPDVGHEGLSAVDEGDVGGRPHSLVGGIPFGRFIDLGIGPTQGPS